jgi:hypothetical protein
MNITLKIPITWSELATLDRWRNDFSCVTRWAFNRMREDRSIKRNDLLILSKEFFGHLDSHFLNSAVQRGIGEAEADRGREKFLNRKQRRYQADRLKKNKQFDPNKFAYKSVVFGSRKNFYKLMADEITKEQWDQSRLMPLFSIGEAGKGGNRKFRIDGDIITLKLNRNTWVTGEISNLGKNQIKLYEKLAAVAANKELAVTFNAGDDYVSLTYDPAELNKELSSKSTQVVGRTAAVDLNPNYIGFVIRDGDKTIAEQIFNLTQLTKKSGKPSSDPISKALVRKRQHETIQIAKAIEKSCVHYGVSQFAIENLQFDNQPDLGTAFNRLVNNSWNRQLFTHQITKRCKIRGIEIIAVAPEYSSFIGNILNDRPDPISAAIEINRRLSSDSYPELPTNELLVGRWKDQLDISSLQLCSTWKQLSDLTKSLKLRVRHQIPPCLVQAKTTKSMTTKLYTFV